MKKVMGVNVIGKSYHWCIVYLDGETINVDKSSITFTISENIKEPVATVTMKKNEFKNLYDGAKEIPGKVEIRGTRESLENLMISLGIGTPLHFVELSEKDDEF